MSKHLEAWKARETKEFTSKDGLTVIVKTVDPIEFLAGSGGTSNPLLGTLMEMAQSKGKNSEKKLEKLITEKPEMLKSLVEMMKEFTLAAVIDPPLTENGNPPEESVSVSIIPFEMKMDIFSYVMGGSEALSDAQNFPEEEGSGVVASSNGEAVPEPAIKADGD